MSFPESTYEILISIPRDVIDLASGEDPAKLIDFLKLKQRTENGENESDDSDQE